MSDAAAVTPAQQRSIGTTAIATGGMAYVYLLADYLTDSIAAGHLTVPSKGLIVMTLVVLSPFVHLIGRIINNRLVKIAGDNA